MFWCTCANVPNDFIVLRVSSIVKFYSVRGGVVLHVEATSFLRHMVRTMVAAMVDAGRAKITARDIDAMIASRDRASAPAAAPACGLFLMEVRY